MPLEVYGKWLSPYITALSNEKRKLYEAHLQSLQSATDSHCGHSGTPSQEYRDNLHRYIKAGKGLKFREEMARYRQDQLYLQVLRWNKTQKQALDGDSFWDTLRKNNENKSSTIQVLRAEWFTLSPYAVHSSAALIYLLDEVVPSFYTFIKAAKLELKTRHHTLTKEQHEDYENYLENQEQLMGSEELKICESIVKRFELAYKSPTFAQTNVCGYLIGQLQHHGLIQAFPGPPVLPGMDLQEMALMRDYVLRVGDEGQIKRLAQVSWWQPNHEYSIPNCAVANDFILAPQEFAEELCSRHLDFYRRKMPLIAKVQWVQKLDFSQLILNLDLIVCIIRDLEAFSNDLKLQLAEITPKVYQRRNVFHPKRKHLYSDWHDRLRVYLKLLIEKRLRLCQVVTTLILQQGDELGYERLEMFMSMVHLANAIEEEMVENPLSEALDADFIQVKETIESLKEEITELYPRIERQFTHDNYLWRTGQEASSTTTSSAPG